ncbi:MAG TPA: tannase/feruloyl esterase family alpha/beta hydrolase [Vicinamibacterales bacterium]|nr:tannase/feruloyl esterase family alpha/beta hydrolase [Vicinamibacterales bacterium]
MNRTVLLAVAFGCAAASASAQPTVSGATECAGLRNVQLPGFAISESTARWIPTGPAPAPGQFTPAPAVTLPAYCRVDAVLDRRTGVGGQQYGIGFALALPEMWNGRLLFQGGSGFNGQVGAPIGAGPVGEMPALGKGFAVVSTDSGHRSTNAFDTAFIVDQQASLDFAYRAVDRVTVVAKAIVAQHYRQPVARSYYTGCSTGGREAMQAAQRHPTEFDGVIVGAPAMRANYAALGTDWVSVQLNQVAPRGANGQPVTREALSSTQKQAVIEGILNACDANDGVQDRLVFNVTACKFDPKTLVCGGGNTGAGCLTAAQASAVERAFAGPRTSGGRQLYSPFPFDTGIADTQGIPGLLHGALIPAPASTTEIEAAARWADTDGPSALTNTAYWTNMTTFANRGGKMLFYHGVSDPTFSALDTIDYYGRLGQANGGADAVREWSRLFLVPGMVHCAGGSMTTDAFDLLTALVDWVERGIAPDAVVATRRAAPQLTRPLCAYPRYAHYTGKGDPQQAASFECRAP